MATAQPQHTCGTAWPRQRHYMARDRAQHRHSRGTAWHSPSMTLSRCGPRHGHGTAQPRHGTVMAQQRHGVAMARSQRGHRKVTAQPRTSVATAWHGHGLPSPWLGHGTTRHSTAWRGTALDGTARLLPPHDPHHVTTSTGISLCSQARTQGRRFPPGKLELGLPEAAGGHQLPSAARAIPEIS